MTGDQLRAARMRLGLSRTDFASLFGVSNRTTSAWERGLRDGKPCPVPQMVAVTLRLLIRNEDARKDLGIKLEEPRNGL